MRILLVDDEPEFLWSVETWLQAHGHRPGATADSRDVLRMIELEDFDLICLDLAMPHIHGLQLIPSILERKPQLPILIMSGISDIPIAIEAARQRIEDYLVKPLDFDKFNAILERLSPNP